MRHPQKVAHSLTTTQLELVMLLNNGFDLVETHVGKPHGKLSLELDFMPLKYTIRKDTFDVFSRENLLESLQSPFPNQSRYGISKKGLVVLDYASHYKRSKVKELLREFKGIDITVV